MTSTHRILIADDEPVIQSLFEIALTEDPHDDQDESIANRSAEPSESPNAGLEKPPRYEVTCCSQGDEAFARVQEALTDNRPYCTVFLDVRMPPGPDGITTAAKIRNIDPDVFIVIVTGFSDVPPKELELRVPPQDMLDYVQKPCKIAKIRELARITALKWDSQRTS